MSDYFNENLLLEDRPLLVLPKLACAFGLEGAIVIQQLYWLLKNPANGKMIDGERWIFNTYETWQEQYFPFWSERTLRRIFTSLEKLRVIQSCQPEGVLSRRKYYRIGNGSLQLMKTGKLLPLNAPKSRCGQKARIDSASRPVPITETTVQRIQSKEPKETANKFPALDGSDLGKGEALNERPEYPAMWKKDNRTKEQKLRTLKMPKKYPSEAEFDLFLESNDLDAVITYRCGLFTELTDAKWHQWKENLGKWARINSWSMTKDEITKHYVNFLIEGTNLQEGYETEEARQKRIFQYEKDSELRKMAREEAKAERELKKKQLKEQSDGKQ